MGYLKTKAIRKSHNSEKKIITIMASIIIIVFVLLDALIIFQHNENTRLKMEIAEKEATLTKRDGLLKAIIIYRSGKVERKTNCMYFTKSNLSSPLNVLVFNEDEILSNIYSAYDSGHYDVASFLCDY